MTIADELAGAQFGDERLTHRLIEVVEQMVVAPDASFPAAAADDAALEATYRFFGNQEVTPERILAPHVEATRKRVADAGPSLVIHDTTDFEFKGDRAEMGWLDHRKNGFFGHFALALANDGSRRPLGILGLQTIFRYEPPKDRTHRRLHRHSVGSEEHRWWNLIEHVETLLGSEARPVHVMDREADSYTLLSQLDRRQFRFVIRMAFDRRVLMATGEEGKVGAALGGQPVLLMREVPIAPHTAHGRAGQRKAHPSRSARIAKLAVSAMRVTLCRPDWAAAQTPATLDVNVVRVHELDVPEGCEPVEWRLVTNEPIDSEANLEAIIDIYRARWTVEEFFKALKTGCAFEKRQLGSKHALLNALAVFAPIAWRLLLLRSLARQQGDKSATEVLTALQLRLLQRHPKIYLGTAASVREAMLAIAQLGGHIKNNGEPGWIVLGRGYEKLLVLEEGALLGGCDQS